LAGMEAESSEARSQSIWLASPRRSSNMRCSLSHTPASCHSFRRLQQVIPDPQPISWGSISQGIPLFSTKTIPVRAARLSMRGLPPSGFGGSGGRSGSMVCHSSSVTSSLAMLSGYPVDGFVRLTKHGVKIGEEVLSLLFVHLLEVGHPLLVHLRFSFRGYESCSTHRHVAIQASPAHPTKVYSSKCADEVFSEVR